MKRTILILLFAAPYIMLHAGIAEQLVPLTSIKQQQFADSLPKDKKCIERDKKNPQECEVWEFKKGDTTVRACYHNCTVEFKTGNNPTQICNAAEDAVCYVEEKIIKSKK